MRIMYPTIVAGLLSRRHFVPAAVGRSLVGAAALCVGVSGVAASEPIRVHAKSPARAEPLAPPVSAANRPVSLGSQALLTPVAELGFMADAGAGGVARAGYNAPPAAATKQPQKQPATGSVSGSQPSTGPVSLPPVSTAVALQMHMQSQGIAASTDNAAAAQQKPGASPSAVQPASSDAQTQSASVASHEINRDVQAQPVSTQSMVYGGAPLVDGYGAMSPVVVGGQAPGTLLGPGEVLVGGDPMLFGGGAGVGTGIHHGGVPGGVPGGVHEGRLGGNRRVPAVGFDSDAMGTCNPQDCRVFYAAAEALYWKPDDDSFTLTRGRQMSDYDYEFAGRVTVGEMMDCINGWEFVYTGPFEWQRSSTSPPPINPTTPFVIPDVATLADIDTFVFASAQQQQLETSLNSFEINRRWFASDLFSTALGLRVVDYRETYRLDSVSSVDGAQGLYYNDLENFLIGAQFGVNMYRPISQRLSAGGWAKLGAFANFAESDRQLYNRGFAEIFSNTSDEGLAGLFQGGLTARYRVLPRLQVTGGYEYLFLTGIATAAEQRSATLTLDRDSGVQQEDDVFFHGANAGVEFSY